MYVFRLQIGSKALIRTINKQTSNKLRCFYNGLGHAIYIYTLKKLGRVYLHFECFVCPKMNGLLLSRVYW